MSDDLPFLKSVWGVFSVNRHLLSEHPVNVPASWVKPWVAEKVFCWLGEETTVDELATICEAEDAVDDCFFTVINTLNEDWGKLLPEYKNSILKILNAY